MKIAHIVYQSLPNISGSSIRTRDLLMSQKEIGLSPFVISSPFQNGVAEDSDIDVINGIIHHRTYNNNENHLVSEGVSGFKKKTSKFITVYKFYKSCSKIIIEQQPQIIHAHATFYCALTALFLSKTFNIPVIYEVRSLWEEREKKQAKSFLKRIVLKAITNLETFCMRKVDKVIVINKELEREISLRGIKNISIIPNGVNTSLINGLSLEKREITDGIVFGYVGSISPIEGLDLLAKVSKELESENLNFSVRIYGDGVFLKPLKELVKALGLKNFFFLGKLKPEEISEAYKSIDVIVNPRLKSKISDTVTPLKPLEAMAYKKLVITSNVGGMRELIDDKVNGLLFDSDNLISLKKILSQVIENGIDNEIVENGFRHVINNKSWKQNAKEYLKIYKNSIKTN